MSQVPANEGGLRTSAIVDGTGPIPFYVKNYKNYITPPFTPIIVLQGQTTSQVSSATLASFTLPATNPPQFLRVKKLIISSVPPSSVTQSPPYVANSVAIQIQPQGGNPTIIYQALLPVNQPFYASEDMSGEDAFYTIATNATTTVALVVSAATYTDFSVVIITETAPLVEEGS
ncbi:hypothetical protein [Los Azufres archaeal virus 1]|nr:hypothetical protein [Los Azufres archaeal virus 1]